MKGELPSYIAGVPTLNRYDLLQGAIDSLLAGTHPPARIIVIDNGGEYGGHPSPLVEVVRPGRNLGVAASWNHIVRAAASADVLLFNDDVRFGPTTVERLANGANGPDGSGLAYTQKHFSAAYLSRHAIDRVGAFDERFYPAYYEDVDWLYRAWLAGVRAVIVADFEFNHFQSASTKEPGPTGGRIETATLGDRIKSLYVQKWGGLPNHEAFCSPRLAG